MLNKTDLVIFGSKIATINNEKAKIAVDTISLGYNVYCLCDVTELKKILRNIMEDIDIRWRLYRNITIEEWYLYNDCKKR